MDQLKTEVVKEHIRKCEDPREFKEQIFPMLRTQKEQWKEKIREIVSNSGYNQEEFAKLFGTSRETISRWCNGTIPVRREKFIRAALLSGCDRNGVDQFLKRYGRFSGLYAKDLDDSVCIFVLQHYRGAEALKQYDIIRERIRKGVFANAGSAEAGEVSTTRFDREISGLKDEDELEAFIRENIAVYTGSYHRLYSHVMIHLMENGFSNCFANNTHEMSLFQKWSASMKKAVSEISTGKWRPDRNRILSIGLHMGMELEDIDEMLELAHMEPLCAKNIFESVFMFALNDGILRLTSEDNELDSCDLIIHVRKIMMETGIEEVQAFMTELAADEDERV